jgi:hypothetical protein
MAARLKTYIAHFITISPSDVLIARVYRFAKKPADTLLAISRRKSAFVED